MSIADLFKSKAEKSEANAKARSALLAKQEKRAAEAIVMDRVLTTMDRGQLGPSWNRSRVSHNPAGGIKPMYPTPWSQPQQAWDDMLSHQEGLSDADISSLNADYNVLNGRAHDSIDNELYKVLEMDRIRASAKGENQGYIPEEGY
jgi:hypothetical protein